MAAARNFPRRHFGARKSMLPVTIVSATRCNEKDFLERSALGRSLRTYAAFGVKARIFFENTRGLGACYNQAIDETANDEEILVFVHDDVTIADFFWVDKLMQGLSRFDVVGLAGNRRRVARQPAWHFREIANGEFVWDGRECLSGIVGHGDGFPCAISVYGDVMQPLKLMDGVLLATRKRTLTNNAIRFDEQFKFHFYDMDICRQLERKDVSMGAVPLGIIHASDGVFGGPAWRAGYEAYLQKWGD
jgi:GT2 family glycosyltransferase